MTDLTPDTAPTPTDAGSGVLRFELELDDVVRAWSMHEHPDGGVSDLAEYVVAEAATQLLQRVLAEQNADVRDDVRRRMREELDGIVAERAAAAVHAVIEAGQWQTRYGGRLVRGADDDEQPRTLAELVQARVQSFLTDEVRVQHGTYRDKSMTRLQRYIYEAVDHHMKHDLKEALDEGREQVRQALQHQGARLLQEAIEAQAAGRG